mmetsp:Transcript_10828/g.17946  ORF Transcript_10828/g.17946 Transcript_10828/m.17946 type:complete len:390 (-) Transcript_10828:60-1229(-)
MALSMIRINRLLLLLVILCRSSPIAIVVLAAQQQQQQQQQDEDASSSSSSCPQQHHQQEDGTCVNPSAPICGDLARCSTTKPFYQRGGTAQAYKPNAPLKNTVCDNDNDSSSRYKAATWPYGRSNQRTPPAPNVTVHLKLYDCRRSTSTSATTTNSRSWSKPKETKDDCCCTPIDIDIIDTSNTRNNDIQLEVWQAQPNGRYSSLTKGKDEGICRATLLPPSSSNTTTQYSFTTVAPGSTGILGGLGPHGWDMGPYGPPVMHVLVSSSSKYHPLLVHIPMTLTRSSLQSRHFLGPDWRGPAHVTPSKLKTEQQSFSMDDWIVVDDNQIDMTVTLYLTAVSSEEQQQQQSTDDTVLEQALCPSSWYGSPTSFFLEPIAVCAPSLLDFFPM